MGSSIPLNSFFAQHAFNNLKMFNIFPWLLAIENKSIKTCFAYAWFFKICNKKIRKCCIICAPKPNLFLSLLFCSKCNFRLDMAIINTSLAAIKVPMMMAWCVCIIRFGAVIVVYSSRRIVQSSQLWAFHFTLCVRGVFKCHFFNLFIINMAFA